MLQLFQPRPDLKSAHVFADHLEATLDLAEELELLYLIPDDEDRAPGRDVLAGIDRIGAFVERMEAIEVAIAAKLELSRAAARRIAVADARLSTFTRLFHAGTQPLVDLWPALADPGKRIFDSGHDPLTYLQSRGVVDESRSTLEGQKFIGTGSDFLLLGTVKLGAFIELCDTCLRALDRHYQLYEDDADWEADRARTLDILRENRDEAIRVALGAKPAVIDQPIEIVASDAVDEAIELIEALTFPEEQRFRPEHPLIEEAHAPPQPETAADLPPIEIVEDIEALATAPLEQDMPIDLEAESVVAEPEPVAPAAMEPPAVRPNLFAPIAAARRSLAAILARRKADAAATAPPAESPTALSMSGAASASMDEVAPSGAAGTAVSSDVEIGLSDEIGATEAPSASSASEAASASVGEDAPSDATAVAVFGRFEIGLSDETAITDAAEIVEAVAHELTNVRQRLVDVIAERARSKPETAAFGPVTPEAVIAGEEPTGVAADIAVEGVSDSPASEVPEPMTEIAPIAVLDARGVDDLTTPTGPTPGEARGDVTVAVVDDLALRPLLESEGSVAKTIEPAGETAPPVEFAVSTPADTADTRADAMADDSTLGNQSAEPSPHAPPIVDEVALASPVVIDAQGTEAAPDPALELQVEAPAAASPAAEAAVTRPAKRPCRRSGRKARSRKRRSSA